MIRIAGLASNRGRNLLTIADRAPGGTELAVVLTNDADAPVQESAAARGIPTEVVERSPDEERREHERRVLAALEPYAFDLVCLDGYMRILSSVFLDASPVTLNVHPSLLPAFPGTDAWGQALAAGVSVTGCTVHVVTDAVDDEGNVVEREVDAGPIVTQEPVPVYAGDTPETLKERVLHEGEFAAYPRAVRWFAEGAIEIDEAANRVRVDADDDGRFPARRVQSSDRLATLRYGENPHQDAALYADPTCEAANVVTATRLDGGAKEMGYNNYNDADAALNLIGEFDEPAAAVIKHANPAGCATAATTAEAYDRALSTDPMSAFGGIVALNRECDAETATAITDSFKEVVVAPAFSADSIDVLREKENLRLLAVGELDGAPEQLVEKPIVGGRLVQETDAQRVTPDDLEVVTEREPTPDEVGTMCFAWQVAKHVKSNAIVFATGTETVGIGMGQVSRVDAVRLAAMKAEEHAEGKGPDGAVMASDAFFPFPDALEAAVEAGVGAVIQPGGSVNDDDVIAAADEHDVAMAFTGVRSFRHG